jgi:large conductance mechanosensitive channel
MKIDIKGFRDFILRGNVVDLAIAVVIGAAFAAVIKAAVSDFITPLISAIFGGHGAFGSLAFTVHNSTFGYGDFIDNVITFVAIAAIIYFFVLIPVNRLMARFLPATPDPTPTKTCNECLSSIPVAATRCAFCTVEQ